jgi:hypothetical protein
MKADGFAELMRVSVELIKFGVIAGLDTASRVYPTCGTLENAELGQARVQVQSIFLRKDGTAGQARG